MALDGGLIKEADGCLQWVLSLCSVVSGLEKPLLAEVPFHTPSTSQMVLPSHS